MDELLRTIDVFRKKNGCYPWQPLSSTALKWIAIITMVIDHVGATLVLAHYRTLPVGFASTIAWYDAYTLLRQIGRIAFPVFCFVLCEGLAHTRSRAKYALRLLLFALVSEIPYDLALNDGVISYTAHLNIMFTLLLPFVAIWASESLGKALKLPGWGTVLVTVALLLGVAWLGSAPTDTRWLASMLHIRGGLPSGPLDVSYHAYGILLVGAFYLARKSRVAQLALGAALTLAYCEAYSSTLQAWAIVGCALPLFYSGKRGRGLKYFFYVFYPAHLLILWALGTWVF